MTTETVPIHVDLESYTSSDGWLGFFELASGDRREHACALVRSLLGKSSGHGKANVYTNAHTFHGTDELRRKYRLSEREVEEYLSPLLTTGVLRTHEHFSEVGAPVLMNDLDVDQRERLLVCLMDVDGVEGHVLVHLVAHDLLVYPHDDVGFGFISGSRRGESFAKGFVSRLPTERGRSIESTWRVSSFRCVNYR